MLQTKAQLQQEQHISMSYEESLHTMDEDTHAEWVNGEGIIFMPLTIRHQEIVSFLVTLLRMYVRFFDLGQILTAPCEMKWCRTRALWVANSRLRRRLSHPTSGCR